MAAYGEVIGTKHLAFCTDDVAGRHFRPVFSVGDNLFGQSRCFVGFGTEGYTFFYIMELQRTCILRNDNGIKGIPLGNQIAFLHHITMLVVKRCTVGYI